MSNVKVIEVHQSVMAVNVDMTRVDVRTDYRKYVV